jgi:hypothetical protein
MRVAMHGVDAAASDAFLTNCMLSVRVANGGSAGGGDRAVEWPHGQDKVIGGMPCLAVNAQRYGVNGHTRRSR